MTGRLQESHLARLLVVRESKVWSLTSLFCSTPLSGPVISRRFDPVVGCFLNDAAVLWNSWYVSGWPQHDSSPW